VKRVLPRRVGSDRGIDYGQQLAHAGRQRDLGQLASGDEPLVKSLDEPVAAAGRTAVLLPAIGKPDSLLGVALVQHRAFRAEGHRRIRHLEARRVTAAR
jgi:hypothetical protein